MKISGDQPGPEVSTVRGGPDAVGSKRGGGGARAGQAAGDTVEVSADSRLVAAALDAARVQPEVRLDLVERVRAEIEAGTFASDSHQLADRLIDRLLTS